MAPTKTKKSSKASSSSSPSKSRSSSHAQPTLKRVKGENFYRDAKKASRVKMLTGGKPVYDRDGKIKEAAAFQKGEDETKLGRVQPDRRWFGNTRVISQTALDHFRTSLQTRANDPYSVLLRRNKLPMTLLDDAANPNLRKRSHIVETEPFHDTFGPKAQRKRPRLDVGTFEELSQASAAASAPAATSSAHPITLEAVEARTHADYIEPIYSKGTSRRIYGELYKVIDSSDVILHLLDARDPLGTMCTSVLEYMKKEKAHKQVVLVLNKCDLVPAWVTARYIAHLTPQYPTLAFHASPNHSFGKGSLIALLRQFSQLHSDKKQISVGLIGYPNVGKSSLINTLKKSKVCTVAPVPGETKVWQYVTLTRRIYLIDCPGIVPSSAASDSNTSTVLKGVVRVEALPVPSEHIPALLERVRPIYLSRTYGLPLPEEARWDPEEFLDKLARMKGRLLKGGEPDLEGVAKIVLGDWVRGRIPFFVEPPAREAGATVKEKEADGKDKGKGKEKAVDGELEKEKRKPGLGELSVNQKLRGIIQKNAFVSEDVREVEEDGEAGEDDEEEDEEFTGFGDDGGGSGSEGEVGADGGDEEEVELQWADVFPEDGAEPGIGAEAADNDDGEDLDLDESSSSSSQSKKKEPRLTTNKRKAKNFYTDANVKNKSRARAKLGVPVLVGGKRRGGRK
ncbi:NGP1NT-domain-containing protein [Hysterangium stoloniferum]|nr:NGP1NT-domain-containing protein [Hysterangium stoloniferum]